jgi:hypothetical protein
MIRGSVQIIGGIPGRYLDPFRVAESQPEGFCGYIVITAETERRIWDILLLAGRSIIGAARVDENHREPTEVSDVKERFARLRDRTRVFLFEAAEPRLRLFEQTLRIVPVLKFHVDSLTRKQMVRLIKDVPGTQFVAERVVSQSVFPLIELLELRSPDQQIEFELRFRKGLLILYRMDGQTSGGEQIPLSLEQPAANAEGVEGAGREGIVADLCARFNEVSGACLKKGLPLSPESGSEIFARIPEIVRSATPFRRPRFRRTALELLGQFYSERFEELKSLGLVEKVESCYRELKG